jgi:O-antigen/teichoic acid export membrane protein
VSVSVERRAPKHLRASGRPSILYALADQGVVSGGNVLTTVMIGRTLGADTLGVYTLIFTALLLANSVVDASLSSSFMSRRPELDAGEVPAYSAGYVVIGAGLIALLDLGGVIGIRLVSSPSSYLASVGPLAAATAFAYLIREHLRRYDLANARTRFVLLCDTLAYGTQILALVPLLLWLNLGFTGTLLGIALGQSAAAAAMLAVRSREMRFRGMLLRRVAADMFLLSRWVLAAHILFMIGLQMMPWLVVRQLGQAAAGAYSAAMTLSNLANPMLTGFVNAMMPAAAAAYQHGPAAVRHAVDRGIVLVSSVTAVICLATAVWARGLLTTLFGSGFVREAPVVQVLAASFFVRALDLGPYIGCWAMRRPDQNVIGNLVAIVVGGGLAVALMPTYGVLGAAAGLLLGNVATVSLRWWNFLRLTRNDAVPHRNAATPAGPAAAHRRRRH